MTPSPAVLDRTRPLTPTSLGSSFGGGAESSTVAPFRHGGGGGGGDLITEVERDLSLRRFGGGGSDVVATPRSEEQDDDVIELPAEEEDLVSPQVRRLRSILPRPTRKQVVRAIKAELGCSMQDAQAFNAFISKAVRDARAFDGLSHLDRDELARFHDDMLVIMPDDAKSKPYSAHDLLERYHLRGKEVAILHTVDPEYLGEVAPCAIAIKIVPVPSPN